uniref:(northern house mosquito) hypothetical protein n=1 Tax=Culex pipiens TaxID=7175 RepID=A0A8D8CIK7_CULPI
MMRPTSTSTARTRAGKCTRRTTRSSTTATSTKPCRRRSSAKRSKASSSRGHDEPRVPTPATKKKSHGNFHVHTNSHKHTHTLQFLTTTLDGLFTFVVYNYPLTKQSKSR